MRNTGLLTKAKFLPLIALDGFVCGSLFILRTVLGRLRADKDQDGDAV